MNDIKVGEYLRLARNQGINRVEEVEDDYYILEDYFGDEYGDATCCLDKYKADEEVLKHSENIIDLIEVGDYVNGEIVLYIDNCLYGGEKTIITELDKRIFDNMIKSIVTHEQFNSVKYVLGGKEE